MSDYVPLTIVGVDEESSGYPERPNDPYDVHLNLSRQAAEQEALAVQRAWGSVHESGPSGRGQISLAIVGDVLVVQNADVELVKKYQQRLLAAVAAGDDEGRRASETEQQELDDRAAHRSHLRGVADELGW